MNLSLIESLNLKHHNLKIKQKIKNKKLKLNITCFTSVLNTI